MQRGSIRRLLWRRRMHHWRGLCTPYVGGIRQDPCHHANDAICEEDASSDEYKATHHEEGTRLVPHTQQRWSVRSGSESGTNRRALWVGCGSGLVFSRRLMLKRWYAILRRVFAQLRIISPRLRSIPFVKIIRSHFYNCHLLLQRSKRNAVIGCGASRKSTMRWQPRRRRQVKRVVVVHGQIQQRRPGFQPRRAL